MLKLLTPFFLTLLIISGCKEEGYVIPTSYSFENVSYTGQTQRLAMLLEMKSYLATASAGNSLSAMQLLAMYSNDDANANFSTSYDPSKQLRNKTLDSERSKFEAIFDEIALASSSTSIASNGVSGLLASNDLSATYLISANGLDYAQILEKGLMGACIYYQATAVYMGSEKMDVDNTIVNPGEGTAMEHHWDEAFGYFAVSRDFPMVSDGASFWGLYSGKRDALLACNQKMMDGFLKGRAAISNNDLNSRDQAIEELRKEWERISVASAIHYLNEGMKYGPGNLADPALYFHGLSEAIGFIYSLKFNPSKTLTNNQIDNHLTSLSGSADFANMNLYNTSLSEIISLRDELASEFNFESIKDDL